VGANHSCKKVTGTRLPPVAVLDHTISPQVAGTHGLTPAVHHNHRRTHVAPFAAHAYSSPIDSPPARVPAARQAVRLTVGFTARTDPSMSSTFTTPLVW
jgi:hypothetical protein